MFTGDPCLGVVISRFECLRADRHTELEEGVPHVLRKVYKIEK